MKHQAVIRCATEQSTDVIRCMTELPRVHNGELPQWLHILPIGEWFYPPWKRKVAFTAEIVRAAYDRLQSYKTSIAVDYEHRASKPDDKRTAGDERIVCYLNDFELRADGIWGRPELWTADGARDVAAGKYRYLSPSLTFAKPHRVTGELGPELLDAGVTNHPRLDGIQSFFAETPAGDGEPPRKPSNERSTAMLEKMKKWLTARGVKLAENAGDDVVYAACEAEFVKLAEIVPPDVAKALGKETITAAEVVIEIGALKSGVPLDVAKAFGREAITAAETVSEVLKLRAAEATGDKGKDLGRRLAELEKRDRDALLAAAVGDGRIVPAQRGTYEALLCSEDPRVRANVEAVIAGLPKTGPVAPKLGADGTAPDEARFAEIDKQLDKQLGPKPKPKEEK